MSDTAKSEAAIVAAAKARDAERWQHSYVQHSSSAIRKRALAQTNGKGS